MNSLREEDAPPADDSPQPPPMPSARALFAGDLFWDEGKGFSCAAEPCDMNPERGRRRLYLRVTERTTVKTVFAMLSELNAYQIPVVVLP